MTDRILTIAEAAEYIGVTKQTLHTWHRKNILCHRKLGGKVFYLESDIIEKIKVNINDSTS